MRKGRTFKRYGKFVREDMDKQVALWLKDLGYRGEGLKSGALRHLCSNQEIINALWHLMGSVRSREEARIIRTKLGQYEARQNVKGKSKKLLLERLKEASEDAEFFEGRREIQKSGCANLCKDVQELQKRLIIKEFAWRYEAGTDRSSRIQKVVFRTFSRRVNKATKALTRRLAKLGDAIGHAKSNCENNESVRESGVMTVGKSRALSTQFKELNDILTLVFDYIWQRQSLERGSGKERGWLRQICETEKRFNLRALNLSDEVKGRSSEFLRQSSGWVGFMFDKFAELSVVDAVDLRKKCGSQENELDVVKNEESNGTSCSGTEGDLSLFSVDVMRMIHVEEFLEEELALNNAADAHSKAIDEDHLNLLCAQISKTGCGEYYDTALELKCLEEEVRALEQELAQLQPRYTHHTAVKYEVEKQKRAMEENQEESIRLDYVIAGTMAQVGKLERQTLQARTNCNEFVARILGPGCRSALREADRAKGVFEAELNRFRDVDMKAYPMEVGLGDDKKCVDHSNPPALQECDWMMQSMSGRDSVLQPWKHSPGENLSKVIKALAETEVVAPLRPPDNLLRTVLRNTNHAEDLSLIKETLTDLHAQADSHVSEMQPSTSEVVNKHHWMTGSYSDKMYEELNSTIEQGSRIMYGVQTKVKEAFEDLKQLPVLKQVGFHTVNGGNSMAWMQRWDSAVSDVNVSRGIEKKLHETTERGHMGYR